MIDYNIEFCHIYADEAFGTEHEKSVTMLLKFMDELKSQDKTFVTTLMIDDYNPDVNTLNTVRLIKQISELGADCDFVVRESQLTTLAKDLLSEVSGKVKMEYQRYISKNKKYPCSFLLSVWHLMRLGFIHSSDLHFCGDDFCGNRTMTILPSRFKCVEEKSHKIIHSTKYQSAINKIEYRYF